MYQPDSALRDSPTKQPGLRWPLPIDVRLDELVESANSGGVATTRQELLTALVLQATPDIEKLRRAVVRLRTARTREVVLRPRTSYPRRGPGRPRRRKPAA